jgi:hypothetical protein
MKLFNASTGFLLLLSVLTASAETGADSLLIKNDDRGWYHFITYDQRGRDVYEASTVPASAEFEIADNLTSIKYAGGRVDKFDAHLSLTGKISPARQSTLVGDVFRWKPSDLSPGKKPGVKVVYSDPMCDVVTLDYKDVTVKDAIRKLEIKGRRLDVPVLEISFDGTWSGSCGSGKETHAVVYSPELGQIVESKFLNYRPNGFLFVGVAVKLKAVD